VISGIFKKYLNARAGILTTFPSLNDRSGEMRCTANGSPLHLRENAASAKAKN
jgi:hypothetical protein